MIWVSIIHQLQFISHWCWDAKPLMLHSCTATCCCCLTQNSICSNTGCCSSQMSQTGNIQEQKGRYCITSGHIYLKSTSICIIKITNSENRGTKINLVKMYKSSKCLNPRKKMRSGAQRVSISCKHVIIYVKDDL